MPCGLLRVYCYELQALYVFVYGEFAGRHGKLTADCGIPNPRLIAGGPGAMSRSEASAGTS